MSAGSSGQSTCSSVTTHITTHASSTFSHIHPFSAAGPCCILVSVVTTLNSSVSEQWQPLPCHRNMFKLFDGCQLCTGSAAWLHPSAQGWLLPLEHRSWILDGVQVPAKTGKQALDQEATIHIRTRTANETQWKMIMTGAKFAAGVLHKQTCPHTNRSWQHAYHVQLHTVRCSHVERSALSRTHQAQVLTCHAQQVCPVSQQADARAQGGMVDDTELHNGGDMW